MGIMDSIYNKKYKELLKKIENLNKKNVKGYKTFKEYVLSDEIMMKYFIELKELEKKYHSLTVDSYETFQNSVLNQLKEICELMIKKINDITDDEEKAKKIEELKSDVNDSFGHGFDEQLGIILNEIDNHIKIKDLIKEKKPNIKERELEYFDEEYYNCIRESSFDVQEAIDCYANNACINCGYILETKLKGNRKCPECKKQIIIRSDIFSKNKLELSIDTFMKFQKYDEKTREILFYERLMKRNSFFQNEYMPLFHSIKSKNNIPRDIIWQFCNQVGNEYEKRGYNAYYECLKKDSTDRYFEIYGAVHNLELNTLEYVTLYEIARYKGQFDVAFGLLTDIAFRDVQEKYLICKNDTSGNYDEDYLITSVHSSLIIKFLNEEEMSINDFKKRFFESGHPFLLEKLSNEETWIYVEKALKRQIEYEKQS